MALLQEAPRASGTGMLDITASSLPHGSVSRMNRVPSAETENRISELSPSPGEPPEAPGVGAQDVDAGGLGGTAPSAGVGWGREDPVRSQQPCLQGPCAGGPGNPRVPSAEQLPWGLPLKCSGGKHPKKKVLVDESRQPGAHTWPGFSSQSPPPPQVRLQLRTW